MKMKMLSSHLLLLLSAFLCLSLVNASSDSLLERLRNRFDHLTEGDGADANDENSLGIWANVSAEASLGANRSGGSQVPTPSLLDRIIEHLHNESELALGTLVPEAENALLKVEGDLAACYDDVVGDVKVNLFNTTLGEVVRRFLKLHSDVLEDGLLSTILKRVRALVGNIRFIARETIKCLIAKAEGKEPTRIGLTPLAAYSHDEFVSKFLNPVIGGQKQLGQKEQSWGWRSLFKRSLPNNCSANVDPKKLPASLDYRNVKPPGKDYTVVTPIRSQGPCSSCFVFASVAAMESAYMMSAENKDNNQSVFSEQALLNCVDGGCDGGYPKDVYILAEADGLVPAHFYPYKANVQECDHSHLSPPVAHPTSFCEHYGLDSDADLQSLLVHYGPVVSAISTSDPLFQFLRGPWKGDCSSTEVDHAVLTVGYTPTEWIIKNSWGKKWGVDGFLVMSRDNTNRCGIFYQGSAVSFKGGIVDPPHLGQNAPQEEDNSKQNGGFFSNLFNWN